MGVLTERQNMNKLAEELIDKKGLYSPFVLADVNIG